MFFALTMLLCASVPAGVLYLCHRSKAADKMGPAALCYAVGILFSLAGLLRDEERGALELMMNVTVPLSIPLLLFSMDLRRWLRLAGPTLLSFVLMLFSALAASFLGYLLLRHKLDDAWKVAGMLIGVYTGGTPNLNAIGLGLKADQSLIILTNTSDMLMGVPWLVFILTAAKSVMGRFLPPFRPAAVPSGKPGGDICYSEETSFSDYTSMFKKENLAGLSKGLGLGLAVFALGAVVFSFTPQAYNMAALMLTITTLGLAASMSAKVRRLPCTFQAGQYLILVFCVAVGALADFERLVTAAPVVLLYTGLVMYGSWLLHMFLSALFRIDVDTVIITSVAAIFSPPFVPVAASALKNKEVVFSGLAAGLAGYALGNYLGITFAHLLKAFLPA